MVEQRFYTAYAVVQFRPWVPIKCRSSEAGAHVGLKNQRTRFDPEGRHHYYAHVAQLGERWSVEPEVAGSKPVMCANQTSWQWMGDVVIAVACGGV